MADKKGSKKPRQERLPGTEDAEIKPLQDAAEEYADIRDQRQALTTQGVDLKKKVIRLMHKYEKTEYHYNGVDIELVMEEESVKARVKKLKDGESE